MPLKRPALTTQLFLAVLAVAALAVLAVGVASQRSFERGFFGYLNGQAEQRMEATLPRLQAAWRTHGSWDFLRDQRGLWFGIVGVDLKRRQVHGAAADAPPQDFVVSDLLGAGRRMALLDARRQFVIGYRERHAGTVQREIVVDGQVVGWLAIAPVQAVTDVAALRFVEGQLQASLVIGLVVVLLAAGVAWWVARTLLAPVRRVAQATHRLAAGAYDTRVPVQGQDEVARLAQDFNQLALALGRHEQLRRDYMADVSHELRTPLAVLRGELEAMEDGVHPVTPEALRLLQAEVATLSQLVHDLHELALADAGALAYRKLDMDWRALVDDEARLARRAAAERGLQLQADLPPQPVPLRADALRLRQLLHNLVGNALRYTDPGGQVQLRLRTERAEAVLDVMDSHPGVPDALLPRLLDRFFRAERSRGRAGGGSGLGLAICRAIVLAHGGQIEARHSPLGGVWIEVRLPLALGPAIPALDGNAPATGAAALARQPGLAAPGAAAGLPAAALAPHEPPR